VQPQAARRRFASEKREQKAVADFSEGVRYCSSPARRASRHAARHAHTLSRRRRRLFAGCLPAFSHASASAPYADARIGDAAFRLTPPATPHFTRTFCAPLYHHLLIEFMAASQRAGAAGYGGECADAP